MDATKEPRPIAVLIADDHAGLGESLKVYFEFRNESQNEYRFRVTTCGSISACIEALRADDYDVLVLDVLFPNEGARRGLELSMLVQRELGADTPVRIIITAAPSYSDCIEAGRAGVWAYLSKDGNGTRVFENVVVDSAVTGLQAVDFRKEIETAIVREWLPTHRAELAKYEGQVVALWHKPNVRVIANADDAYALSDALRSWKGADQPWQRPMFFPVGKQRGA